MRIVDPALRFSLLSFWIGCLSVDAGSASATGPDRVGFMKMKLNEFVEIDRGSLRTLCTVVPSSLSAVPQPRTAFAFSTDDASPESSFPRPPVLWAAQPGTRFRSSTES
ncbi:hypothetical protein OE88DRAFT_1652725 [Heliocybe sulcata]|uniref:Secreted protein n=1 Tax=Heliocybe sulcata TaxID=5364 RepID=A0A5C3NQY3_9AGAM|nr:hypothetical protein OE88DRAFT_1652725 [Heliocybe sulcata]